MKKIPLALGFRVEPKKVHWAIVKGNKSAPQVIFHDNMESPKTYNEGQSLTWYRQRVLQLLEEHKPESVGIRYQEPCSQSKSFPRYRIEGVILEVVNSKNIEAIAGSFKTLSAKINSKSAKKYITTEEFRGLDLSPFHKNIQEAIIAATAALND